jgi:hypothetical protein
MSRARYPLPGQLIVVQGMDELVETANPEWFAWLFDQTPSAGG